MNLRKLCVSALASLALVTMIGSAALAKEKITIAYVEWDCAVASTYTVKAALETMGYEVEVLPVAAAAMWQAVGSGDVDAMVTAWLPVTHKTYYASVADKVEKLGPVATGAKLGWAVPTYVTIDSIEELNANAAKFDNKIIGIDPGAGLMGLSEKAIKVYGLDKMELLEGSGATMTAALGDAIKNKKWAVVTAWSPHWMFGRWDLKYLKDPKKVLGEEEKIYSIVRKDLKKDMPKAFRFFENFAWESPKQLQMVMAWNQEDGASPLENGKKFIKEHPEMLKKWTK
jgi:glycine betaine/proline transport system substrate-binding protein